MHNSLEDECGRDLPMVEWERICFGGVSRKDEKETGLGATLNLGHIFGYIREKVEEGMSKLILPRGPLGNCVVTGDYDRNALDATLHKFCKS